MAGPLRGTIGGRYALCGEIASGGMATVHLARQGGAAGFARIVAIKRLHERYARDPEFVAMFLDEARIVARMRHPNVVQTIDVVAEDGELFLVMEYVHGESLLRIMAATNLPCGAYANGDGEPHPDQGWIFHDEHFPESYGGYAREWLDAGALIVGGCCGTTPEYIKGLRPIVDEYNAKP